MTNTKNELLNKYKNEVNILRQTAKDINLTDNEIDTLFEDCLNELQNEETKTKRKSILSKLWLCIKVFLLFISSILLIFIFVNNHQPTFSLVMRNVQIFIYPGLKLLRLLTIPIIRLFPSLSELYDETCLMENPYFQVVNMECWPCENVHSVINLTQTQALNLKLYQSGIPYIIKTLNNSVTINNVQELYKTNTDIFNDNTRTIKSNNPNFIRTEDILNFNITKSNTHISWRMNQMAPARVIRTIFPKPEFISQWSGQSTERYVFLDDFKSEPYILPNPECSNVLLTQGSGERTIILKPSVECAGKCRTISVSLKATYSLWYNWWYWRPLSLPIGNATEISISYLSSFC